MFLVGVFSTHIGIAIIWLAYLIGMACYSFGVFGAAYEEISDKTYSTSIEYTQVASSDVESRCNYYFIDYLENDSLVANIIEPIKFSFIHFFYLDEISINLKEFLFNQFIHTFQFSRPPPVF